MPNLFHRLQKLDLSEESSHAWVDGAPVFDEDISTFKVINTLNLFQSWALKNEVELYRHRVEALVHFLETMASECWDRLYPYGKHGEMLRRPSRSAAELRAVQIRLVTQLSRLSSRFIASASKAVISIEKREVISVLPSNILSHAVGVQASEIQQAADRENIDLDKGQQLTSAYAFGRCLGNIERLKQILILNALEWIIKDGNDKWIRICRLQNLVEYVKPSLIENYGSVSAIIRHYFRRAPKSNVEANSKYMHTDSELAKTQLRFAFCAVTANALCTTSNVIMNLVRKYYRENAVYESSLIGDEKFNLPATCKDIGEKNVKHSVKNFEIDEDLTLEDFTISTEVKYQQFRQKSPLKLQSDVVKKISKLTNYDQKDVPNQVMNRFLLDTRQREKGFFMSNFESN